MSGIVGFFLSGTGRWLGVALALLLWTAYQRDQAADKAREECKAEQLQATLDETLRQLDESRKAVAEAETRADETESELVALEAQRKRISDEAKQSDSECVIPESITRELRNIK